MPSGIGYGPLPLPAGLQQPDPLQNALIGVPSGLVGPDRAMMIPPPVLPEEPPAMPVPSGLQEALGSAPVPLWLQQQLAQREQPTEVAPPAEPPIAAPMPAGEPDEFALPEGVDPDGPVGLTIRGLDVQHRVLKARQEQTKLAEQALGGAEARTAQRREEIAARQERARERITEQNAQIQQALKSGPGSTWRDVAFAGASALGAVLGAAFDRSGALQKALPQTLNAIVGQWQERTQAAFGRELQALQVGREGAQDELDAALDDDRRAEQAGAAARVAILEEANRRIQEAVDAGQLDMLELQRIGVPQQMQAELEKAYAKQALAQEEEERKRAKEEREAAESASLVAYREEQAKSERADRQIARERLKLDKSKSIVDNVKDQVAYQKAQTDLAIAQGNLSAQQAERQVLVPGTDTYVSVATPSEATDLRERTAATETFDQFLQEIENAANGTTLDKAQTARWAAAITEYRGLAKTGTLDQGAMDFVVQAFGDDPAKVSIDRLRDQKPLLQQARRTARISLGNRFRNRSADYKRMTDKDPEFAPRFTEMAPAADAVPETPEDALGMLLPGTRGERPRIGTGKGQVKPEDFDAAIKTVREVAAKSVGGTDRDAVVRVQAEQLVSALSQVRAERERVERERDQATRAREALPRGVNASAAAKEAALTEELRTVQEYEKRVAEALKRERRLLWQKAGDPKLRGKEVDRATLRRVEALIGPVAGKTSGGK